MTRHRSHLALTVWPIALLTLLEIARLWPALGGATAFAVGSPDSWLALAARTALVLAFLAAYVRGWGALRRANAEGPGPYRTVGNRRLQRASGAVAWTLVLGHLGLQWYMFFSSGPAALSHYEILRQTLSLPWVLGLYVVGLGALGLYLSQGFAVALRGMGFAEEPKNSRWLSAGCTLLAVVMLMMAVNILSHFSTGRAYWSGDDPKSSEPPASPNEAP